MKKLTTIGLSLALVLALATPALASHSWGGFHWASKTSPFTLQMENDLTTTAWNNTLGLVSADWTTSSVLDTNIVNLRVPTSNCSAILGKNVVCNKKYGFNGWLGRAQVWVYSDGHIAQGTVKVNDSYFNTARYNTETKKRHVMCQEVGHTLGLDHQDESGADFNTCMDYSSALDNPSPNAHDFEQLIATYSHIIIDTFNSYFTTSAKARGASAFARGSDFENASEWGKVIRKDSRGNDSLYERDLGNGNKVFTFVIWAE